MTSRFSPSLISALVSAYRDGMPVRAMGRVLKTDEMRVSDAIRHAMRLQRLPKLHFPADERAAAAIRHAEIIRGVADGTIVIDDAPEPEPTPAYTPLHVELGIRVFTRPDGVSLPFIPSIHGGSNA